MESKVEERPLDELEQVLFGWCEGLHCDPNGEIEIPAIDPKLIKEVFTAWGADFNPENPNFGTLREYSNLKRRPGMDAVWGEEVITAYNAWTRKYVDYYEASMGKSLPALEASGEKISGPRQFLGELTAYAAGFINPDDFSQRMEVRIYNGWLHSARQEPENSVSGLEKRKIQTPAKKGPMRVSSIPPEFAQEAIKKIQELSLQLRGL